MNNLRSAVDRLSDTVLAYVLPFSPSSYTNVGAKSSKADDRLLPSAPFREKSKLVS